MGAAELNLFIAAHAHKTVPLAVKSERFLLNRDQTEHVERRLTN